MKVCPDCQQEYADTVDFCPNDGMKLRSKRGDSSDPLIGTVLDGRWIIEEKIGEGGMGAVYKGHQKSVNRKVAVKTLRPALTESDEFVDRFFREAKIATRINHPNCVTILDFGQADGGTLYLAMEYMEGAPLSDRMLEGTLTIEDIVKIGIQVSSALSAAHDVSIVHRDLKPDNIFLVDISGGGMHAKVLDFGIAKALDSKTQVTKTGMIFGTPEYMSPEQCRGTEIDGRSDLYSLGCILYELLGGRTPFSATTPMAILLAHVNDQVAELQSVASHIVPANLNAIVMKLLEKDPDKRYPDAQTVKATLEGVLGTLDNPRATISQQQAPIGAVSGFEQTAAAPAATDELVQAYRESSPQQPVHETEPKSSKGLYIALGVVLVLVAVAGGTVLALNPALLSGKTDVAVKTTSEEPTEPEVQPEEVEIAEKPTLENEEPLVEEPAEKETEDPTEAAVEIDVEQEVEIAEKEEETKVAKKKRRSKKTRSEKPSEEKKVSKNVEVQEKVEETKKETAKTVEKKVNEKVKKEVDKTGKALNKALDDLMGH